MSSASLALPTMALSLRRAATITRSIARNTAYLGAEASRRDQVITNSYKRKGKGDFDILGCQHA